MAIGTDECLFMKVVVLSSKFANSFCNLQIGSTVHAIDHRRYFSNTPPRFYAYFMSM